MLRNILAVVILSLTVVACDSGTTDTNSNANSPAKATPAAATPAPSAAAETNPAATTPIKAGDKVKAANGSFTDANVLSVDEKAGKATIKVAGENKERVVALSEVVKQ